MTRIRCIKLALRFPAVLLLAGALVSPTFAAESIRPADGRQVFRQQCAKCHGKNGEGVKGKYDDALHGDWSIEKLTRVIEKTMPEDDPDKINGPEVEAVARYIHDTFYSQEARARNHPARVELVRLTNRQYVNTVADLLKSFAEPDAPLPAERGLRGNYRDRTRGRGGDGNNFERVDRGVSFDFGSGSPFTNTVAATNTAKITNDFSINWRGSVIAEESGDYEIILKTPNGARLWLNDDDRALIDAGVASGDTTEHKATLRLIGGRAYPLRLEFFKAPRDKTSSIVLSWRPPHGAAQAIPARNLLPMRVSPTFVVTTRFPADDSSVGYERGVLVSKAWDEATTQAAFEVAGFVERNLNRLSNSRPSETSHGAKVKAFCEEFVTRAFRRPLTPDQKRRHLESFFKDAAKPEDAVKRVVLLTLKSPRFLYLGLDDRDSDDYDAASRLSFALWDSLPDAALMKAAAEGALHTREQIRLQSERMLANPRTRSKLQSFLHHWLQLEHVESLAKDDQLFPGFTPEIIADLRTSLNLFLADVVWSESSDYRRLLLEDDLFVNERLAGYYGITTDAREDFIKLSVEPRQRAGVVTHPYLLAAFSYPKSTSPIHRGVFLTRNIIGRALKPPPVAVAFKDAEFSPEMTMREKVAELTRPQACQGCHAVINPLGFSLEHFDAVGRLRTKEGNRPIDAVSEYTTDAGDIVKLTGARDVAQFAVGSEHAQEAFIEQLFHQIVKQPMLAYGTNVQERLRESFVRSGFNIQKLVVEVATLSAAHDLREKPARRGG